MPAGWPAARRNAYRVIRHAAAVTGSARIAPSSPNSWTPATTRNRTNAGWNENAPPSIFGTRTWPSMNMITRYSRIVATTAAGPSVSANSTAGIDAIHGP